jgi:hypothetical protein
MSAFTLASFRYPRLWDRVVNRSHLINNLLNSRYAAISICSNVCSKKDITEVLIALRSAISSDFFLPKVIHIHETDQKTHDKIVRAVAFLIEKAKSKNPAYAKSGPNIISWDTVIKGKFYAVNYW